MDERITLHTSADTSMLESIVARALDPESIASLVQQFAVEKTLGMPGLTSHARDARVRIQSLAGTPYILCPVPPLFDETRGIETGFALDVDQDHFDVYPFMCSHESGEHIILSRLPHCVVRAIKVDAGSYQAIDDKLKEVANESSAILFISNLYTELGVGLDSPVEFFDDRLFQQLIGKVLSVKEGKWVNYRIVSLRFNQLIRQLDMLDEGSTSYAENKQRVIANLAHFVFETTRIIRIEDLLASVDPEAFYSIIDPVIAHLLSNRDYAIVSEMIKNACYRAPRGVLAPVFSRLVAGGHFDHALALERVTGQSYCTDVAIARDAYAITMRAGSISRIDSIASFLGIPFDADPAEIRRTVNDLVSTGRVADAIELERLAGGSYKPDENVVREAFATLLAGGRVSEALRLDQWTGISYQATEEEVVATAVPLLAKGDIAAVELLISWTRVAWHPRKEDVQGILSELVRQGRVDSAIAVESWSKTMYESQVQDIQAGYKALLPDAKAILLNIDIAKRLGTWIKVPPAEEFVHELYTTALHAPVDEDRRLDSLSSLLDWTGVKPRSTPIIAEFKAALRPGQLKNGSVSFIRRLSELAGIRVPSTLASEAFTALLSPPLRSYSIDDAAQLFALTGSKPGLDLIQTAYRCILERQVIDLKETPVAAARRLQDWTSIPPNESVARTGQDLALLRGDLASARGIGDWMGIKPSAGLVRDAIAVLLQHPDPVGEWHDMVVEIANWTGIKPDDGMIQSAYTVILLGRWLTPESIEAAESLDRLTHVEPETKIVDKAREKLAREVQLGYERSEVSRMLEDWIKRITQR